MKKRFLLLTFTLGVLAFTFMSNSGGRASVANADSTGANGGPFCQQCHSAGAFNPSLTIELLEEGTTNAVTQYVPGMVYDVKMTVTADGGQSGFGAQMAAFSGTNVLAGLSAPSSNAQVGTLNGGDYLEQSGLSTTDGVFSGKWTAPAAGTGDVTFFGAGIAANGNGMTGGDGSTKGELTITEDLTSSVLGAEKLATELRVFPNPVANVLNIETVGTTTGQHTLTITNMVGQVVLNQQINLFGNDRTQFDVSHLATGNYNLTLAQDGKIVSAKIIKR